jgi:hypothetical protein
MHSSAKLFILTITISIITVLQNVSQVWNTKWHGEEDISCKVQLLPNIMLTIKGQYCPSVQNVEQKITMLQCVSRVMAATNV